MAEESPQKEWPTRCDMPDLSELQPAVTLSLILHRMFAGGGPTNPKSFALVANLVRIVDALVRDYEYARLSLTRYVNTPNEVISPLFEAISYSEECITNLLRAIRMARRIRSDEYGPPIDKYLPVLHDNVASRVTELRNAIEHVDGALIDGTWSEADPNCLITRDDRLELYGKEILYVELAKWITALHTIAVKLAQFKKTNDSANDNAEPK